jgi:hypothetical protein
VEEAGRYLRTGLRLRIEIGIDGNLRQIQHVDRINLGTTKVKDRSDQCQTLHS